MYLSLHAVFMLSNANLSIKGIYYDIFYALINSS